MNWIGVAASDDESGTARQGCRNHPRNRYGGRVSESGGERFASWLVRATAFFVLREGVSVRLSEKQFMGMVIDLAKLRRWFVYHTHDARRSVAGFPDLVLLRPPQKIVAELKIGRNKPTAEQNLWLNLFEECGVPAYVWRPTDWSEIESVLK